MRGDVAERVRSKRSAWHLITCPVSRLFFLQERCAWRYRRKPYGNSVIRCERL